MDATDVAQLADGIAAAALVALAGHPLGAATVSLAWPILRSRLDRQAATREVQRRVTRSITAWANRHGVRCITAAYTDHASDLPMLALAQRPVAVNPTRRLKTQALRSAMVIEDWDAAT